MGAVAARGICDQRVRLLACGVGERDPVVLVEIEAALAGPVDIENQGVQRLGVRVLAHTLLRDDRSFANEHRRVIHGIVRSEGGATLVAPAGKEIDPLTRAAIRPSICLRVSGSISLPAGATRVAPPSLRTMPWMTRRCSFAKERSSRSRV